MLFRSVIVGANITNPGAGYTSVPNTYIVTDSGGYGARIKSAIDAIFIVALNKKAHKIVPSISHSQYKDTSIESVLNIADKDTNLHNEYKFQLNKSLEMPTTNLVASHYNEAHSMAGSNSVILEIALSSTNKNVSPVINMNAVPTLGVYNNVINNQNDEIVDDPELNSEELYDLGHALSRYITRPIYLANSSTGLRLLVDIFSTEQTGVDWYIKTSLSGSGVNHQDQKWQRLECDVERNKSEAPGKFYEYEFKLDDAEPFDTYNLKCVMRSTNPAIVPIVQRYRVIVLA